MIIGKKILPEYFAAVKNGTKTFELRKDEDNIPISFIFHLNISSLPLGFRYMVKWAFSM